MLPTHRLCTPVLGWVISPAVHQVCRKWVLGVSAGIPAQACPRIHGCGRVQVCLSCLSALISVRHLASLLLNRRPGWKLTKLSCVLAASSYTVVWLLDIAFLSCLVAQCSSCDPHVCLLACMFAYLSASFIGLMFCLCLLFLEFMCT